MNSAKSELEQRIEQAHALLERGSFAQAESTARSILETSPRNSSALMILGLAHQQQDDPRAALAAFAASAELDSGNAWAYVYQGAALISLGQYAEAVLQLKRAVSIEPVFDGYMALGFAEHQQGNHASALNYFEQAALLSPESGDAHNNAAAELRKLGRLDEASNAYARAEKLLPENWAIPYNKGLVLTQLDRMQEANQAFDRAITLNPSHLKAKHYKAMNLLALGRFSEGWPLFEWRFGATEEAGQYLASSKPALEARSPKGRLYIWSEQGLGDTIFFSRWLAKASSLSEECTVSVDQRLVPIISRSFKNIRVISNNAMLTTTEYDHHLPIGSLPKALIERGVDWKKDASARFFYADRGRSDQLRSKLCRNHTLLCGITWKSFRADLGLRKSLDLKQLKPLFDIPNIRLVNLQYGDVRHETDAFEAALGRKPFFDTKIDNYHDLDGHSALIDACDLLIMSCNASAHLAGAMGKNVFLLAPRSQSRIWYWSNLNDRRSAWYPSIEIFDQSLDGSWTAAIRSIEERLRQHINHLPSR